MKVPDYEPEPVFRKTGALLLVRFTSDNGHVMEIPAGNWKEWDHPHEWGICQYDNHMCRFRPEGDSMRGQATVLSFDMMFEDGTRNAVHQSPNGHIYKEWFWNWDVHLDQEVPEDYACEKCGFIHSDDVVSYTSWREFLRAHLLRQDHAEERRESHWFHLWMQERVSS